MASWRRGSGRDTDWGMSPCRGTFLLLHYAAQTFSKQNAPHLSSPTRFCWVNSDLTTQMRPLSVHQRLSIRLSSLRCSSTPNSIVTCGQASQPAAFLCSAAFIATVTVYFFLFYENWPLPRDRVWGLESWPEMLRYLPMSPKLEKPQEEQSLKQ